VRPESCAEAARAWEQRTVDALAERTFCSPVGLRRGAGNGRRSKLGMSAWKVRHFSLWSSEPPDRARDARRWMRCWLLAEPVDTAGGTWLQCRR
jgi:hypothetical protein